MRDAILARHATAKSVAGEFDRIGDAVGCWRLSSRESNQAFAWRLAIHIQEQIIDREQLLEMVLSLSRFPPPATKGIDHDIECKFRDRD